MSNVPPLVKAIVDHDLEGARKALREGADPRELVSSRRPLHHAGFAGNAEAVPLLIEAGADPNEPGEIFGMRPLHDAARTRSVDVMLALVEGGADMSLPAARDGDTPVATLVLEGGSPGQLEQLAAALGEAVIDEAKKHVNGALGANVETARWLVGQGGAFDTSVDLVEVASRSGDGPAALELVFEHGASAQGTTELAGFADDLKHERATRCVRLLLDHGAEINSAPYGNWTALAAAVHNDNTALALELLDRGADPHLAIDSTPYDYDPRDTPATMAQALELTEVVDKIAALGIEPSSAFDPLQHPGLHGHNCYASLVQGRSVELTVDPDRDHPTVADLERAVEHVANRAKDLGVPLVARVSGYPSTYELTFTHYMRLTVGILVEQARDDEGPQQISPELAPARSSLKKVDASLWEELDGMVGTSLAKERPATWLVAAGPVAGACLGYGVEAESDDFDPQKGLTFWEGSAVGQRRHGWGVFGVVQGTDSGVKVSITPKRIEGMRKKLSGFENPGYWLIAAYD